MFKSQDIEKSKGVSNQSEPSLISRTVAHSKIYLTQQYEEYPYRWINFVIFLLACLVQAISMHAFTPVANQIKNIYNIQSSSVTLPALLFMVVSPPAMIIANFITDKFGTTVGGLLLIIGTGLKCLVNKGFIFVYIGSCVNGAANNLILNSPSKVASNWFKPVNSGLIGVFFTLAILTSTTWGVFIPPFFINQTSNETSVFNLLFFEFILTSSAMILMIVLLKESPPTPPSQVSKEEKASFLPQIKILFSNKNYILIFLVMGLLLGGYSGFISVIAFYFKPYDIDSNSTSLMILGCTIGGAFSSIIVGFYIKKTKKLKFTAIIGLLGSLSMFALIQLTLNIIPNFALLCVAFTITGCTVFPVIPCLLELGSEVSYPVSQPIATGFLFCSQQIFGFIIGFLSSYILEISEIWAYIYFQAIFIFAFVLMIMVKEEFLRTKQNLCSTINIEGDIDAIEEIDIQDITEQLSVQGIL
ncbi:Major facilitator superfamily domain, general substrate transporter [Pseudocohnilembus persalinus]|uniref:Major facilitator superfamily domain, general substrate transporter n=1 Tax=Pseudocohnilembus persalinus TaxID=266149 RepID=A0A0V0QSF6_PSEPJ|nr:Major facilitator superfamily domain, general substrate transporter [Pseudocohnilembus persalinus]|eukprot:KRX05105.1 Major facilitator superfamily domain, general substrate transporter [Pseudocohnilembus persalinus]